MNRTLAKRLFEIKKLETEYDRRIYPEELIAHNICPRSEIKGMIETLLTQYAIDEKNVQGANAYHVTNIGINNINSYLDLKRELARA